MTGAVQRVAVLGGGIAAPMAALAIRRAYGRMGVTVRWHDDGTRPPRHAALVAPPDLVGFHGLLGIGDAALIDHAHATLTLGQQFVGWGGDDVFLHAYGDAGTPFASLPFIQHWTRARHAGLRVPLEEFCIAAVAAKQGRVGAVRDPAVPQAVKPGRHLDAQGYAAVLRAACRAAGVEIVAAEVAAEADLIVDARDAAEDGAPAPLCDRMILASAPPIDPIPLHGRMIAHDAGWIALTPLADRVAVACHYASARMREQDALAALQQAVGRAVQSDPAVAVAARRVPGWTGNRVTIAQPDGIAATLDGAGLIELQLAIAQLILLWPIDRVAMIEAEQYGDELRGTRARIADFSAQHFRLNARGSPFWEAARAAPMSLELAAKIDLFAARGMVAHFDQEAHVDDGWALCMAGHGVVPRSHDPQALLVEDQALMAEFQRQLCAIAAEVRAMPTHAQALAALRSGR
ncbi:tryptophan 7-halogenase [Sphingomonas sp. ST-64]|uniref:Tryptophan 7-halogenase n=1 Tax=Sphingomonas plantiphila TaxID=3163295 RepID=A0ABW8YJA7_9SPHN